MNYFKKFVKPVPMDYVMHVKIRKVDEYKLEDLVKSIQNGKTTFEEENISICSEGFDESF